MRPGEEADMINYYEVCRECLEACERYAEGLSDTEPAVCAGCPFEADGEPPKGPDFSGKEKT